MSKIALLMPTRERLNLTLTIISSIITTVDDINNVVLYCGIDDDDPTKDIMLKICQAIPFVKYVPIHNNGKFMGLSNMWNILANNSNENIFGYIGSDMIFKTTGWDTKILEEFNEQNYPKDGIKLVYCYDGHRNGDLCTNAFIGRKYYDFTGYLCRSEFRINWSDRWLMQVFGSVGRLKYRPDIEIFHNHWVYKGREIDKTGKRMMEADKDGLSDRMWMELAPQRVDEIKKLSKYLNVEPNWGVVET